MTRLSGTSDLNRFWNNQVAREASRAPKTTRLQSFHDAVPWLGPMLFVLAVAYFVVQVIVASVFTPGYSWLHNSISDLGNTACTSALCSPRHVWMNREFWLLGFVMAVGSVLIYHEFALSRRPEVRLMARWGFVLVAIGGVGAVLVGSFPENTVSYLHIIGAALAIGIGTVGIFGLGIVLDVPSALRWSMRLVPPFAVLALILFACHVDLGVGSGFVERIAAYPETLWLIVFGVYIMRSHGARQSKLYAPPTK